jgi:RNA polymerase sigma factor (sigma-70 family)
MQEEELIANLRRREENAYVYCISAYQDKIFKLCLGLTHSREDAEDICQEVFIELFHSIDSFRGNSSVITWLYRIAVNKSLNHQKKVKRQRLLAKVVRVFAPGNAGKESPDKKVEQKEVSGALFKALDKLPENQRIAYTLAKYDDLSYDEIAEAMGLSLSSVESLMFRAKENLKKSLLNYYENNFK